MKEGLFQIIDNIPLTDSVFRLSLRGDTSACSRPGQFAELSLPGFFLRRPISVCNVEGDTLTLIYKCVGRGTEALSKMRTGSLHLLTGLGNGYDTRLSGERPLLIGGGVGVPPLYLLARTLLREGKQPAVILGFNKAAELFLAEEFRSLGIPVTVTTADGSCGQKGFVTDAARDREYSYFYACGPKPMLRALCGQMKTSGQLSLEERMGCGFGACMGCSVKTKNGFKRVCKDGPVFEKEALLWED